MPLLNDADAIYLGATPVDAVYLGSEKVWPPAVQYPYPVWHITPPVSGSPYPDGQAKLVPSGAYFWLVLAPVDLFGKDAVAWVAANSASHTTLFIDQADGTPLDSRTIAQLDNPASSGNIGIKVSGVTPAVTGDITIRFA